MTETEKKTTSNSSAIYRTYDRVKELKQQNDSFVFRYYLIGFFALGLLAIPTSELITRLCLDLISFGLFLSLWGISPILDPLKSKLPLAMQAAMPATPIQIGALERNEPQFKAIATEISKEQGGLEAENRVAQALKDTFKPQKVKVFARLDQNCLIANTAGNSDLDVLAVFPKGQNFAISVKKREAKAVYLDADSQIRLARKGSTVKLTRPDPAIELIEQEKWLRQHRKKLLLQPGQTVVLPSVRVLVFATPTIVGELQPHQYVSIGNKKFAKVERGKDIVYLLQEDQLCGFVRAILRLK